MNISIPEELLHQMRAVEQQCGRINWSRIISEHLQRCVIEYEARAAELLQRAGIPEEDNI